MRIAVKSQNAGWVLDNIVNDYRKYSRHEIVSLKDDPDLFWSVSPFLYPSAKRHIPKGCKKVIQLHHIDEQKLNEYNFKAFNTADACLVPNRISEACAKKYINIPIKRIPYWVLSSAYKEGWTDRARKLKEMLSSDGEMLIGSFVKDGNGKKGDTPKLSKGPDTLISILEKLSSKTKIKVVLAGYARNYVRRELDRLNIPYRFFLKTVDINQLYDCIDWYLVTSRYEGGPQSVLEASYRNVKILSTEVGLAPEVLHPECICDNKDKFVEKILSNTDKREYNRRIAELYIAERIVPFYDDFFEELVNEK